MRTILIAAIAAIALVSPAFALDADDLQDLVGYKLVAFTNVDGDFEGAEHGKLVQLENYMVFEFNEYNYSYAYRPSVIVLAEHISAAHMLAAGIKNPPTSGMTLYKLIIDDEIYDVSRIR